MKKRNRMLAILLAFTMVLTFMPMLAFAEGEEADADPQATEATVEETDAEAVEAEAVEEVAQKEAAEAVEEEAKPTSLTFTQASGFEFEAKEGDDWMSLDYAGNTFVVGTSNGNKTFKSIEYTGIDSEDGSEYQAWGFFLDGDSKKEEGYFGYEINGVMSDDGGKFKAGDNTVRFTYGYGDDRVFTKAFTVKAEMSPVDIEFIPASGVTLWGFEGARYIDGNEYYAEGNKFVVTYSDNKTKKEFIAKEVEVEENGRIEHFVGYFEDGVIKKNAKGEFADEVFDEDIPETGLKKGNNSIRFGLYGGEGMVWSSKTYNVIGKPYAVSASYTPTTVNATIYPEWDDIRLTEPGSQFVVKYNDNTTKTFKPVEVKFPDGGIGYDWKCGDEELQWGYDYDGRLKEGSNKLTLYLYNVKPYSDDDRSDITCTVNVNASKVGVCTTHKLRKVKATKATCQAPGIKAHYQCTACLKIFTDKKGKKETTYAKLATKKAKHVFKKKIVSDEYLKSPATCTKKATYYYACKTCGEKGKKTFTAGKALGHKFENSVTKATPTKNGSIGQKCTVCGKKGKGKVIPKASKIAVVKKYKKKGVPAAALAGGAFIEVKNAKGKKIAASEYDIAFNNNEEAGTGSATITFKGDNYEGSKVVSYKIVK